MRRIFSTVLILLSFLYSEFSLANLEPLSQVIPEYKIINFSKKKQFFNPYLVLAITRIESRNNSFATLADKRPEGDFTSRGLMQIIPATAERFGVKNAQNLYNWQTNVSVGMKYLIELSLIYGDDMPRILAAYNAGKVFICMTGRTKSGKRCKRGKFVNQPYVDKVMTEYANILEEYSVPPTLNKDFVGV